MKRQIKFRAWDSVNKVMESDIHHLDSLNEILHKDKYEVMQFTGVLHRDIEKYNKGIFDENGMEMPRMPVYEGDIVEFKSDPSFYINAKVGDRYIIEYYGAGFFMKPISWGLKKLDAQNYIRLLPPYQTSNMSNHYEVIGNIYQNPELLQVAV